MGVLISLCSEIRFFWNVSENINLTKKAKRYHPFRLFIGMLAECLADKIRPVLGVEEFTFRFIGAFISMGTKEVTLSLQEVCW